MKYICMNCPLIIRMVFLAAILSTPFFAVSADNYATGVRKESCKLYDIVLPENWISKDAIDAAGMPPTCGALLLDATGGETKCHLSHQKWQFFDINHLDDTQYCNIESYILPSGAKPDFKVVWDMIDRRSHYPASSKWIRIEGGYMKSLDVENEGWKVTTKGLEKVVNQDRCIDVLREGPKYVHHLHICVPAKRYRTDENFRRMVDNVWKNWKLKK